VSASDVTAAEVLRRHEAELLALPNVTGVGLGQDTQGREVIVVFVRPGAEDLEEVRARIPGELENYRTDIRPEIRVFPGRHEEGGTVNGS
jgi:hypothetical protein